MDALRNGTHKAALLLAVVALVAAWACKGEQAPPKAVVVTEQPQPARIAQRPVATSGGPTRTERDLLGEKAVPANAYYGVQTARALENFQISGIPINHYPGFVEAWAIVKLAAARARRMGVRVSVLVIQHE